MRNYVAANPRHRHGIHRYDQASFGLTPGEIESAFKRYCDHFGVTREG
jgi:hypothetical protein